MNNALIGAGAMLAVSFLVSFTDKDFRRDLWFIVGTVLVLPAVPLISLSLYLAKRSYRVRRVSNETLRRVAMNSQAQGLSIHREGRYVLVFTDPKKHKGGESDA